jgi:hypothetical protein
MTFQYFPYVGKFLKIPTEELIFFRGVETRPDNRRLKFKVFVWIRVNGKTRDLNM